MPTLAGTSAPLLTPHRGHVIYKGLLPSFCKDKCSIRSRRIYLYPFEGKKTQNGPKENAEVSDTDEKPLQPEKVSNITNEEKNNRKAHKPILGQPVRRENPNRSHEQKIREEAQEQPDRNPEKEERITREESSGSSWADALQKAMQAISQDK